MAEGRKKSSKTPTVSDSSELGDSPLVPLRSLIPSLPGNLEGIQFEDRTVLDARSSVESDSSLSYPSHEPSLLDQLNAGLAQGLDARKILQSKRIHKDIPINFSFSSSPGSLNSTANISLPPDRRRLTNPLKRKKKNNITVDFKMNDTTVSQGSLDSSADISLLPERRQVTNPLTRKNKKEVKVNFTMNDTASSCENLENESPLLPTKHSNPLFKKPAARKPSIRFDISDSSKDHISDTSKVDDDSLPTVDVRSQPVPSKSSLQSAPVLNVTFDVPSDDALVTGTSHSDVQGGNPTHVECGNVVDSGQVPSGGSSQARNPNASLPVISVASNPLKNRLRSNKISIPYKSEDTIDESTVATPVPIEKSTNPLMKRRVGRNKISLKCNLEDTVSNSVLSSSASAEDNVFQSRDSDQNPVNQSSTKNESVPSESEKDPVVLESSTNVDQSSDAPSLRYSMDDIPQSTLDCGVDSAQSQEKSVTIHETDESKERFQPTGNLKSQPDPLMADPVLNLTFDIPPNDDGATPVPSECNKDPVASSSVEQSSDAPSLSCSMEDMPQSTHDYNADSAQSQEKSVRIHETDESIERFQPGIYLQSQPDPLKAAPVSNSTFHVAPIDEGITPVPSEGEKDPVVLEASSNIDQSSDALSLRYSVDDMPQSSLDYGSDSAQSQEKSVRIHEADEPKVHFQPTVNLQSQLDTLKSAPAINPTFDIPPNDEGATVLDTVHTNDQSGNCNDVECGDSSDSSAVVPRPSGSCQGNDADELPAISGVPSNPLTNRLRSNKLSIPYKFDETVNESIDTVPVPSGKSMNPLTKKHLERNRISLKFNLEDTVDKSVSSHNVPVDDVLQSNDAYDCEIPSKRASVLTEKQEDSELLEFASNKSVSSSVLTLRCSMDDMPHLSVDESLQYSGVDSRTSLANVDATEENPSNFPSKIDEAEAAKDEDGSTSAGPCQAPPVVKTAPVLRRSQRGSRNVSGGDLSGSRGNLSDISGLEQMHQNLSKTRKRQQKTRYSLSDNANVSSVSETDKAFCEPLSRNQKSATPKSRKSVSKGHESINNASSVTVQDGAQVIDGISPKVQSTTPKEVKSHEILKTVLVESVEPKEVSLSKTHSKLCLNRSPENPVSDSHASCNPMRNSSQPAMSMPVIHDDDDASKATLEVEVLQPHSTTATGAPSSLESREAFPEDNEPILQSLAAPSESPASRKCISPGEKGNIELIVVATKEPHGLPEPDQLRSSLEPPTPPTICAIRKPSPGCSAAPGSHEFPVSDSSPHSLPAIGLPLHSTVLSPGNCHDPEPLNDEAPLPLKTPVSSGIKSSASVGSQPPAVQTTGTTGTNFDLHLTTFDTVAGDATNTLAPLLPSEEGECVLPVQQKELPSKEAESIPPVQQIDRPPERPSEVTDKDDPPQPTFLRKSKRKSVSFKPHTENLYHSPPDFGSFHQLDQNAVSGVQTENGYEFSRIQMTTDISEIQPSPSTKKAKRHFASTPIPKSKKPSSPPKSDSMFPPPQSLASVQPTKDKFVVPAVVPSKRVSIQPVPDIINPQVESASSEGGSISDDVSCENSLDISAIPKDLNGPKLRKGPNFIHSTPLHRPKGSLKRFKKKSEQPPAETVHEEPNPEDQVETEVVNQSVQTSRNLRSKSKTSVSGSGSEPRLESSTESQSLRRSARRNQTPVLAVVQTSQPGGDEPNEPGENAADGSPANRIAIQDNTIVSTRIESQSRTRGSRTRSTTGSGFKSYDSHRKMTSRRLFNDDENKSLRDAGNPNEVIDSPPKSPAVPPAPNDAASTSQQYEELMSPAESSIARSHQPSLPQTDEVSSIFNQRPDESDNESIVSSMSTGSSSSLPSHIVMRQSFESQISSLRLRSHRNKENDLPRAPEPMKLRSKYSQKRTPSSEPGLFDPVDVPPKKRQRSQATRVKLFNPGPKWKKSKELYAWLKKKLQPTCKLRTNLESERLVIELDRARVLVSQGHKENALELSVQRLKRLQLCTNQLELWGFLTKFMPFEFVREVVPLGGAFGKPFDIQDSFMPDDPI